MSEHAKIDTHHHIVPPLWREHLERLNYSSGQRIPAWSPEGALAAMDEMGIATAVVSLTTPGVHFGDAREARAMARRVNDYTADLARDHPGRFGLFATLPVPDVEGSLAELDHALGTLHADGVVLLSNTRGTYLGDPLLEPLMEELNRRDAVVLVHPAAPALPPLPGVPPFVADYLLDTTRAALNLVRNGVTVRCPRIRIILSHAGGMVPYAAGRIALLTPPGETEPAIAPDLFLTELRRFYFDTALSSASPTMRALRAFAAPDRILFGSDWPYAPGRSAFTFTRELDALDLPVDDRTAIHRGNAAALFPRLARLS
ncbi:amidohydrolase family protein [Streptomyces sp. NPDC058464]|uniref:amidohydrolase family protein n=1 Tax=Streptomyces sp. NPDC058464 TaxID=3346511 RepID=UPI003647DFCA